MQCIIQWMVWIQLMRIEIEIIMCTMDKITNDTMCTMDDVNITIANPNINKKCTIHSGRNQPNNTFDNHRKSTIYTNRNDTMSIFKMKIIQWVSNNVIERNRNNRMCPGRNGSMD